MLRESSHCYYAFDSLGHIDEESLRRGAGLKLEGGARRTGGGFASEAHK